jgi:hypothetical protein
MTAVLLVALPTAALGLPSSTAEAGVYMVDGPVVNDIVLVGGNAWIGGEFSRVENGSGSAVASASGLAVFDAAGHLVSALHDGLPTFAGSSPVVYDLSLGSNGILYVAGKFNYSVGGTSFRNLIGINPLNGKIAATFNAEPLKSVLATSGYVYGGGTRLWRFALGGGAAGGSWHAMVGYVNDSLRGHEISPAFREIELASAGTLIVVGQFDWIDGRDAAHEKKVAVLVNASTGQPQLGSGSWALHCGCATQSGAAFGLAVEMAGDVAYVAAGGNDWLGAFRISNGSLIWLTDVNGSAQDVAILDGSSLIVGGHWTSIEVNGAGDQSAGECPPRNAASQSPCWLQPRLAAVSRSTGLAETSWTPNVCCMYRGIWATTVVGSTVHVGGEFTRLDGESGPEHFYGRFS